MSRIDRTNRTYFLGTRIGDEDLTAGAECFVMVMSGRVVSSAYVLNLDEKNLIICLDDFFHGFCSIEFRYDNWM